MADWREKRRSSTITAGNKACNSHAVLHSRDHGRHAARSECSITDLKLLNVAFSQSVQERPDRNLERSSPALEVPIVQVFSLSCLDSRGVFEATRGPFRHAFDRLLRLSAGQTCHWLALGGRRCRPDNGRPPRTTDAITHQARGGFAS